MQKILLFFLLVFWTGVLYASSIESFALYDLAGVLRPSENTRIITEGQLLINNLKKLKEENKIREYPIIHFYTTYSFTDCPALDEALAKIERQGRKTITIILLNPRNSEAFADCQFENEVRTHFFNGAEELFNIHDSYGYDNFMADFHDEVVSFYKTAKLNQDYQSCFENTLKLMYCAFQPYISLEERASYPIQDKKDFKCPNMEYQEVLNFLEKLNIVYGDTEELLTRKLNGLVEKCQRNGLKVVTKLDFPDIREAVQQAIVAKMGAYNERQWSVFEGKRVYTHPEQVPQGDYPINIVAEQEADMIITVRANFGNQSADYFSLLMENPEMSVGKFNIDIQYNFDNLLQGQGQNQDKEELKQLITQAEFNLFGITHPQNWDEEFTLTKGHSLDEVIDMIQPRGNVPPDQGISTGKLDRLTTVGWSFKGLWNDFKSAISSIKVPEYIWKEQTNNQKYYDFWGDSKAEIWRDVASGTTDATLAEVKSLPELGVFIVDITTDSQFRGQIIDAVSNISWNTVEDAIGKKLDDFTGNEQYYHASFSAVEIATIIAGIGGAKKIRELIDILANPNQLKFTKTFDDLTDGIADNLKDNARRLFQEIPQNTLSKLKNLDEVVQKRFLDDWLGKGNQAFRDAIKNNDKLFDGWKDVASISFYNGKIGHDIRLSILFLEKYNTLSSLQKQKLINYLTEQKSFKDFRGKINYTAERNIDIGDGVVRKYIIDYDEFGFPKFEQYCPNGFNPNPSELRKYFSNGKTELDGKSNDFTAANNWLKEKYPNENIIKTNTGFKLSRNGQTIEYTWHHHQDGINIFPVPRAIHNVSTSINGSLYKGFPHSGGKALIYDEPTIRNFFPNPNF